MSLNLREITDMTNSDLKTTANWTIIFIGYNQLQEVVESEVIANSKRRYDRIAFAYDVMEAPLERIRFSDSMSSIHLWCA